MSSKEKQYEWRRKNPERFKAIRRKSYHKNADKNRQIKNLKARKRWWANREKERARSKVYYHVNAKKCYASKRRSMAKNPEKYRASATTRMRRQREKINMRILNALRCRIRGAIVEGHKSDSTIVLLGCSIDSFKIHLESFFEPEMSWQNYGKVWEIDHVMPCAIFDLTKPEHQRRCFHFSNMRPMFVRQNRRKHSKVITDQYCLL